MSLLPLVPQSPLMSTEPSFCYSHLGFALSDPNKFSMILSQWFGTEVSQIAWVGNPDSSQALQVIYHFYILIFSSAKWVWQ